MFFGHLAILRGLVCSSVLVCGEVGTEGFVCSSFFTQLFVSDDFAELHIYLIYIFIDILND